MIKKPFIPIFTLDPFTIGSLVTGGVSLLGGLISGGTSLKGIKEANKGNLELAKYGYAQNLEQWHRENEYNTPSAQMTRLKMAGLNPNLVYGNGQAVTKAADSPDFKAPTMQAWSGSDFGVSSAGVNAMNTYLSGKRLESDIAKQLEETNNLRTQNDYMKQRIADLTLDMANKEIKNARDEFDLNVAKELRDVSIQTAKEGLRKLTSDTDLAVQRRLESEENVRKIQSETKVNEQRARKILSEINEVASRIALNNATTRYTNSRTLGQNWDNSVKQSTYLTTIAKAEQDLTNAIITGVKDSWSAQKLGAEVGMILINQGWSGPVGPLLKGTSDLLLSFFGGKPDDYVRGQFIREFTDAVQRQVDKARN